MPVEVQERFESRRVSVSTNPSAELRFWIRGTDVELEARTALIGVAPVTYNLDEAGTVLLPILHYEVEPAGPGLWDGTVVYGWQAQASFSFDTTGGTQKIFQSRQTVHSYAPPGKTAPNFKGAIGVTADSVEGVEITVPVYAFTETYYLADSLITPEYKATVRQLTGRVNSVLYKGYEPGELLFLGAQGAKNGYLEGWTISYKFASAENETGITIGDITGIEKKGWEYLWVRYADTEDTVAKALVKTPIAVYIEEVLKYGDLNLLGV